MNNRFRFRYWDKQINKMRYGDIQLGYDGQTFVLEDTEEGLKVVGIDDIEIMQYTGIDDKVGNPIFEGDIIKTSPSGYFDKGTDIFYVKYCCTGFFLATPYRHMEGDWECSDTIGTYDSNLYECIGNIYMNPELLEVKDEHT